MNSLATPPIPPHFHEHTRLSPSRSMSTPSASRKRKASPSPTPDDDPMTTSPAISNARLPQPTPSSSRKKIRPNLAGRPLSVDRLLETLDTDSLRSILRSLCDHNPAIRDEVVRLSPRPSVASTLQVLRNFHAKLMSAFPLDPNPRSDYCYDRVRPQWHDLLNALADFTPHFLPPNETQSTISLSYLDGVTQIIHELPRWDSAQHNLAKDNAYDEITHAWVSVIREASKRGGGIQLQVGRWEEKLRRHNEVSGGRMGEALEELASRVGWLNPGHHGGSGGASNHNVHAQSIRQQLLTGTYGSDLSSSRMGSW